MITLPDTLLDKLWNTYADKTLSNPYSRRMCPKSYSGVLRRSSFALRFEELLFAEGAVVRRVNKKCYLQFTDENDALVFRLKYS